MKNFFNWFHSVALFVSLFFIVLGANWAVLDRFGSDMPNWDQWDAEGLNLLAPSFEHDHFVSHLFQPHNEHRVVVTKLHNLALTLLDDQWDARLESVTNAALHAALAVAFWLVGTRWLAARWHAPLFVALASLFSAPTAWENILGGFHSQQYWLLLLSFVSIVALPFVRPWSNGWWAAVGATALAMLTMASGFFAAAIVFCVVVYQLVRRKISLRNAWPTVVFTFGLIAIGWFARVEFAGHEPLKAKTVSDFIFSILHSLQWPAPRAFTWLAAVLWLPWILAAWRVVINQTESRATLAIVALGGWVIAQIIATAYARGARGDYPATRYMDTLIFGIAANALALGLLLEFATKSRWLKVARGVFAVGWIGVFAWGIYDLAHLAIAVEMPDNKRSLMKAESHLRGFLATNDSAQLAFDDIPYPDAGILIARLSHPSLRALMPVSIRPPLPLMPAKANAIFSENHASQLLLNTAPRHGLSPATIALASLPTWGSFGSNGPAATGEWVSAPLTAPLGGWLKFETAGDVGRDGVALELRDAQTRALLCDIQPTKIPGDTWRAAYVPAPRMPFVVVARDESPSRWMAFSAPVEMGNLSYLAWCCAKNGLLVAEVAAVAAVLGLAALVAGQDRRA